MEPAPQRGIFPSTHWSAVTVASESSNLDQGDALGKLLSLYQPALMAHLTAKFRVPEDRAADYLQGFIAAKVLEKEILKHADRSRGRFRTFLLNALDNYVVAEFRREKAQKRCPAEAMLQLEALGDHEHPVAAAQSSEFDLAWARSLLQEAMRRMQTECTGSGREDIWELFSSRLISPLIEGSEPVPYEALVSRFHLQTPAQAFNLLTTGKRMFARVLRSVIAEYARDEKEIELELAELRAVVARQ